MELYIPPPTHYLPRMVVPPRPVVPTVPVVPCPPLPEELIAPEGTYHLAKGWFPDVEVPGPLPTEQRPQQMPLASAALIGAGGFSMGTPAYMPLPPLASPNIFAVSSGSTLVNGQWQPGHPTKMSFADVWFPSRETGKESSFGALVRRGLGKRTESTPAPPKDEGPPPDEYEFSDTESESSFQSPAPVAQHQALTPEVSAPAVKGKFGSKAPKTRKEEKRLSANRGGFITRVSPNLNLGSIMDDKGKNGGERVRWAFWNMGRLFCWAEEGGAVLENLATVVFQNAPTTHALSTLTTTPGRQDIVVGFETGDLVYLDFINDRTERFNVGGKLIKSAVTAIHFDPRGGDRFLASFADNTVAVFHLFAEDPSEAGMAVINSVPRPWDSVFEEAELLAAAKASANPAAAGERSAFQDRVIEWKNTEWAVPADQRDKRGEKYPWAGKNPLSVARLGTDSTLTGMAYSPDGRYLALITRDGLLRLLDTEETRVTDVFQSYFGGLRCVAWSPDSRFVAVGGQDDLITIYSPRESRVVARCQGHTANVTGIAFDPTMRSAGRGYRFGSVGEDGKLLLWDFSAAALRKPRHHHHPGGHGGHHRHGSIGIGSSVSLEKTAEDDGRPNFHPPPSKADVAMLQPVLARQVEGNLMSSLYMGPKTICTVSRAGSMKFWIRPPRQPRKKSTKKQQA